MPLGREKALIRLSGSGGEPIRVRWPARVIPSVFNLTWLLWKDRATAPVADETIEECGNGATRGYRLEYTTDETIRFTTYSALGASSVESSNSLAGEDNVFFLVQTTASGTTIRVRLNNTLESAAALAAMAAPTSADDRFLLSRAGGASPLFALAAAQCTLGRSLVSPPAALYPSVRRAQRLLESASILSYIDWTRQVTTVDAGQSLHFGDSVTGARIDVDAANGGGSIYAQADRDENWSQA